MNRIGFSRVLSPEVRPQTEEAQTGVEPQLILNVYMEQRVFFSSSSSTSSSGLKRSESLQPRGSPINKWLLMTSLFLVIEL